MIAPPISAATGGSNAVLLGLPAVLFVRMAFNAIDGMLAREHGQETPFGARLNEAGDVVSDIALYLPFALVMTPAWPIVLAVFAGITAEYAGVLALVHGNERRYDGPLGKSDRAGFFGLVALLQVFVGLSPAAVIVTFLAATAASGLTIINRLLGAQHHA